MTNKVLLGLSKVDITPQFDVETIGFSRRDNLSRGVLHKLYAQISIWLSDEIKNCLVTIDSIGFSNIESNIVRDEISNKLGINRDNVMLCFSHTHSGPNVSSEQTYFEFLRKKILIGLEEAERCYTPIKAVWSNAYADIGVNRRDKFGILDKRIGVLKIVDANTLKLRLILLRVTAHANVLKRDNYLISSDYIGITRELLEDKYDCMVMITQGASGNVEPKYTGTLEALDKMAFIISESIDLIIDSMEPKVINKISMFSHTDTFYADVPTMDRAYEICNEAMIENGIDGTNWIKEVERLNNEKIKQQSCEIEVQYFNLNEGCLCGVPNEIMCELAIDVVNKCDDLTYFGAYTNGCEGYLANANEYDKGGYEVLHSYLIYYIYSGMLMPFNRDTADKLVKMVTEQWNELK